jgi:putative ABC transport system permease protein
MSSPVSETLSSTGIGAVELPAASRKPTRFLRLRTMVRVGIRMMFHDKLRLTGTLFGVIFAVVLANQQIGVFLGLLSKNAMFIDNAGAGLWIVPGSTQTLQAGKPVAMSALYEARTTPGRGLGRADPVRRRHGFAAVGRQRAGDDRWDAGPLLARWTVEPRRRIGRGTAPSRHDDLRRFRARRLGGLNLGSVREVNHHRTVVGGFA